MTIARVGLNLTAALVFASTAVAGPVVRQATGANAAAIEGAVASFRTDLGGANNGATPGSQPNGRREITWDGVTPTNSTPAFPTPMTTFANRGAVFATPGSGFEVSGAIPEFGNINGTYPGLFAPFSLPRLFTALNSNVMDVTFVVPGVGSTVPAAVTGFGAVFTDVDAEAGTKLEFYAPDGALLYEAWVPATSGSETLSFLGVSFDSGEVVGRVRLVSGNAALGPDELDNLDVVTMDDFIYGEPVSIQGLYLSPETGRLYRTGAFDIVVALTGLDGDPLNARVRLNGMEVTHQFRACAVHARHAESGDTFRCPAPRAFLPPGDHVLQLELTLRGGTRVRNAVRWTIINSQQ
jgi:hypothetical protein